MGFLDDLSKAAGKAAGMAKVAGATAIEKGGDMVEIGKLKVAVTSNESKINELHCKIGEAIYKQCAEDGNVPDYVKEDCIAIYNLLQDINELKGKIEAVKLGVD